MYLRSIAGKVLFEGRFHTVRHAVEAAVKDRVCLDFVNLRGANLIGAELDGISLKKACLWGSKLTHANLSEASLQGADCRNSDLKETCLADSHCHQIDFRGSYFSNTILRNSDFSQAKFSCPSIFNLNLVEAQSLKKAIYSHQGEFDCDISNPPIVIRGLEKNIILMNNKMMIGNILYDLKAQDMVFSTFQTLIAQEKNLKLEELR